LKAMVLKDVKKIVLEDVPYPKPGPNEVTVRVAYCGVCKTDVHMYFGNFFVKTPIILGHECSGTVHEVGDKVTEISVGDRVAINPSIYCGRCRYCLSGRTNLCENSMSIGGAGETIINGAYAEYVKVPERNLVRYDKKKVSFKHMALTEPLACAVHGMELARVSPGDRVVVIGAGPMGLLLTQLSAISGSSQTIVLDLKDERLELAKQLGASDIINPGKCDPLEAIKEITDGELADVVIEAVGSIKTVEESFKYVKKGGRIVIFGVSPQREYAKLSPFDIYFRELEVIGSYAVPADSFIKAAKLISHERIKIDPIITEIYPLEKVGEAIEKAERCEGLKKLIEIGGEK